MPVLDTPITTDDRSLKKVLGQKQPALLLLHDGSVNKPLDDALRKIARKHAGDLLVVRVDASQNPETHAAYSNMPLPAIVTMTEARFGRKVKSQQDSVRPADIRAHVAHLLDDKPLPQPKTNANGTGSAANGAGKGHPVAVSDATWRKEVLKSKQPVLVDFWAAWCGPCRSIAPYVEKMAQEYKGQLKVVKLDTDHNPVISRRYQIQSIPTFALFENGQQVARISGANPGAIKRMVENHLGE